MLFLKQKEIHICRYFSGITWFGSKANIYSGHWFYFTWSVSGSMNIYLLQILKRRQCCSHTSDASAIHRGWIFEEISSLLTALGSATGWKCANTTWTRRNFVDKRKSHKGAFCISINLTSLQTAAVFAIHIWHFLTSDICLRGKFHQKTKDVSFQVKMDHLTWGMFTHFEIQVRQTFFWRSKHICPHLDDTKILQLSLQTSVWMCWTPCSWIHECFKLYNWSLFKLNPFVSKNNSKYVTDTKHDSSLR